VIPALTPLLRLLCRPYLALYDLAMRLGPKWGPVALGYGPVVIGIAAFLLKSRLLDPIMDPGHATILIFALFLLSGPLMNVGTKIVTENLHKGRTGAWPGVAAPGYDPRGKVSPTMAWVEGMRVWSRGQGRA
jgi:hypothetical protein